MARRHRGVISGEGLLGDKGEKLDCEAVGLFNSGIE